MGKFKLIIFIIVLTLVFGNITVSSINNEDFLDDDKLDDDFYFVHLTDTHVRHRIVDLLGRTTKILNSVLDEILSFEEPPAFIVITGDLCEWAGNDPIGAKNCEAFVSCFYEQDDQL